MAFVKWTNVIFTYSILFTLWFRSAEDWENIRKSFRVDMQELRKEFPGQTKDFFKFAFTALSTGMQVVLTSLDRETYSTIYFRPVHVHCALCNANCLYISYSDTIHCHLFFSFVIFRVSLLWNYFQLSCLYNVVCVPIKV